MSNIPPIVQDYINKARAFRESGNFGDSGGRQKQQYDICMYMLNAMRDAISKELDYHEVAKKKVRVARKK